MKRSEVIQAEKMSADAHSGKAIHQKWVANYRTQEMQVFYDMAFNKIVKLLNAPPGSIILDAGCGSCAKSVLLASKGFRVTAVDYSADALKLAEETVCAHGLADCVTLKQEDLLGLSFPDRSFQYLLCWEGGDAYPQCAAHFKGTGANREARRNTCIERRQRKFHASKTYAHA